MTKATTKGTKVTKINAGGGIMVDVVEKPKKAPKKPANKPAIGASGDTQRVQIFKLLKKKPLTGRQIADKLGVTTIPTLLKDEGVSDKPRIKRAVEQGVRGVVYSLTARGLKDLEAGKVDENAPKGNFSGVEWKH